MSFDRLLEHLNINYAIATINGAVDDGISINAISFEVEIGFAIYDLAFTFAKTYLLTADINGIDSEVESIYTIYSIYSLIGIFIGFSFTGSMTICHREFVLWSV